MKFKINRNKVIASIVMILILGAAFWYGGTAPGSQGWKVSPDMDKTVSDNLEGAIDDTFIEDHKDKEDQSNVLKENEEQGIDKESRHNEDSKYVVVESDGFTQEEENSPKEYSKSQGIETEKEEYPRDSISEEKHLPVGEELTATLSVRCDTILDNIDWLNSEKLELVPKDGVIFVEKTVIFYEGESVFDLLLKEMKNSKIHMEFTNVPIYDAVYIEGINNLYELDCGELSGWMYKVNGWFPNYGSNHYLLKEGDIIEWVYTCDLGGDIGGFNLIGGY